MTTPPTSRREQRDKTLPPVRGLRLAEAANHVGIPARAFSKLVKRGDAPQPKIIDRSRVWDVVALDEWFAAQGDANRAKRRSRAISPVID